jgi:hypothetical protein
VQQHDQRSLARLGDVQAHPPGFHVPVAHPGYIPGYIRRHIVLGQVVSGPVTMRAMIGE